MVQVASSIPADSEPLMWFKDTFTIDVSMISISVGSMTVKAISPRLVPGFMAKLPY